MKDKLKRLKARFSRSRKPRPSPKSPRASSPPNETIRTQDMATPAPLAAQDQDAYASDSAVFSALRRGNKAHRGPGKRLLSLDGGQTDVLGSISQLLMIQEFMRRLEYDLGRRDLRPRDWFDMIGGSGTGGLVAIMLGILGMTVPEAINAYEGLFPAVFSDQETGIPTEAERTRDLDEKLEKMIKSTPSLKDPNERLMIEQAANCKVFICAIDPANLQFPVLFRTYRVRSNASHNCSVKEAARAATAIYGEYSPIAIGDKIKQQYISASHCYNNPTEYLLKEAKEVFRDSSVSCVVSLGTGHPGVTQIKSPDALGKTALRFARNSESVSEAVFHRLGNVPSLLYRFNVNQGMQWGLLYNGSKAASDVQSHTSSYLTIAESDKKVDNLVESLRKCEGRIIANDLGGPTLFIEHKDTAEIHKTITKQHLITLLDKLQPVEQAQYNATSPVPRHACTENTRIEILSSFISWARNINDRKIYYLNGMAGTGKTTLAYTLCQILEKLGFLGGSFFCSRADHSCSDANRIAPTLAFHLARYFPEFCKELVRILDENAGQTGHNVDIRFSNLVVKPLKSAANLIDKPVIVVIDALDECRTDNHVLTLMHNLWIHASDLPIKFFVTSRPERPFHNRIYRQNEISTKFHLHNVESSLVERDIRLFLKERLWTLANDYRISGLPVPSDWPPETQLNALTNQSGKLFIYAATACLYISGSKLSLSQRLASVVGIGASASKAQTDPLDSLYTGVLEDAYAGCEESERDSMDKILRTVVSTFTPLSVNALAELLNMDIGDVHTCLSLFHSVLNVPLDGSLVTTLHASFPDYLSTRGRSQHFYLDSSQSHSMLTSLSLKLMEDRLRENMCNQDGYPNNNSIPGALLEECISRALSYACSYWPAHVCASGDYVDLGDSLRGLIIKVFKMQSLMWIECLSYVNALYQAIRLLQGLERWIPETAASLVAQILDVRRFISQNIELLSINALETYNSALLWLPETSFIRQKFGLWQRLPNVAAGLSKSWDPCEMILTGHSGDVSSVTFSPDGARIASGSGDETVRLWNATTGEFERELTGHSHRVYSVAFSPDGARIASGSWDKTVRIWNATTGEFERELTGHSHRVYAVAFSPDGARIVSGSYDKTVRIWNATTGEFERELTGHSHRVYSVAFSPDGARIVSGSYDKTVRIWNATTGEFERELTGHSDRVCSVAFSPDGARIVSGSWDKTVRIWNATTGEFERELTGHSDRVRSVAFSPDGARIVSGSWDKTVRIWNATTGEFERELTGHSHRVYAVAFSPDGARIVSGSWDKTVRIWNAITGEFERELTGHSDRVCSVAFSPDGARIVSSSDDETVRIWNATTGKSERELTGHSGGVNSVAFSSDGARIASGSWDNTVRIWNASTGKSEHELTGHPASVWSVVFSPDGARIASGSWNNAVRIWNATTGELEHELTGHLPSVLSVAFSPDGTRIAAEDLNGMLLEWDVKTGELQQDSRQQSGLSDYSLISSSLHLSEDRRWLMVSGTSRKYWLPPAYANFELKCFHSNKAVFGYSTGRVVIIIV